MLLQTAHLDNVFSYLYVRYPQTRASHRMKPEAPAACSALYSACHCICGLAHPQYVMKLQEELHVRGGSNLGDLL
jgi:hypothetical protein